MTFRELDDSWTWVGLSLTLQPMTLEPIIHGSSYQTMKTHLFRRANVAS